MLLIELKIAHSQSNDEDFLEDELIAPQYDHDTPFIRKPTM